MHGTATRERTYTFAEIARALNTAADDIAEAADLPDTGTRDALNFLVNAAGERLDKPDMPLAGVADKCYALDGVEMDDFQHMPEEEQPLAVVLGWIAE